MKPLSEQFPISTFVGETQKQLIEFVEKKIHDASVEASKKAVHNERTRIKNWAEKHKTKGFQEEDLLYFDSLINHLNEIKQ